MTPQARTIAGWAAAYAATECIVVVVASISLAFTWPGILTTSLIEGLMLGILQGLLLFGRRFRPVLVWTLATSAGVLAARAVEYTANSSAFAATIASENVTLQVLAGSALGLCIGAITALAQAFVLPQRRRGDYRWIAVCSVAWALTLPALLVAGKIIAAASYLSGFFAAAIVFALFATLGALVGMFEGAGLAFILRPAARV